MKRTAAAVRHATGAPAGRKGVCTHCQLEVFWQYTRRGRPIALEPNVKRIFDVAGDVHIGHEPHVAYCQGQRQTTELQDARKVKAARDAVAVVEEAVRRCRENAEAEARNASAEAAGLR